MKFPSRLLVFLTMMAWLVPPQMSSAQQADGPCSSDEASQFDFWLGQWSVAANGREVGRNRISKIQGGCTLLEEYSTQPGGFEGKSFNYYDPSDGKWHQVWVDNAGTRLHLRGGFADGKMVMAGKRMVQGMERTDRITWHDNPEGTVRQVWEVSVDDGDNWQVIFDGLYRRMH